MLHNHLKLSLKLQVHEDADAESPTGAPVTAVTPTEPGRLMAHHCIYLETMVKICMTAKGAGG